MKFLAVIMSVLMLVACGGGSTGVSPPATTSPDNYQVTSVGATINDTKNGVVINVPEGASSTAFNLSISKAAASATSVQLVNGVSFPVAGSQFTIESDLSGNLNKGATVTIPYDKSLVTDSKMIGVVYYSPAINKYVPVEILSIDQVNGTVTFDTSHFSIWISILGISSQGALNSVTTDFNPINDGFPFQNSLTAPYGIVNPPPPFAETISGNCAGMSALSIDYYHNRKLNKSGSGLNQLLKGYSYDCSSSTQNQLLCIGINKASMNLNSFWNNVFNYVVGGRRVLSIGDRGAASSIYSALTRNGNTPVMLGIQDGNRHNGHAVVVYKYIAGGNGTGAFYYYDPNLPNDQTKSFSHGADGTIAAFSYEGGTSLSAGYIYASSFVGGEMTPDQANQIFNDYFPNYVSQGGLTWMPVTFSMNFADANTYCNKTAINGQTGWRMAEHRELINLDISGAMKDKGWKLGDTWSSTLPDQSYLDYLHTNKGVPVGSAIHVGVMLGSGTGALSWNYDSSNKPLVSCVR